jgi:hypothetical protein
MLFIQAPELFTTTLALAIPKAITNAGLEPSHVDFYGINEAFSQYRLLHLQIESFSGFLQFFLVGAQYFRRVADENIASISSASLADENICIFVGCRRKYVYFHQFYYVNLFSSADR